MKEADLHGTEPPSDWVKRWSLLVKPQGTVLDIACGHGRHSMYFHQLNHQITLVDRAQEAIESIAIEAQFCEKVVADIENASWPLPGRQFDAVVVTNYLWRPLMPTVLASLAPGGVLIYETFAQGNESVGKPSRPDFLLRSGELLEVCRGLFVVAYENGFMPAADRTPARFVQRIAAVKAATTTAPAIRYPLAP